jgi:hypothetical protein
LLQLVVEIKFLQRGDQALVLSGCGVDVRRLVTLILFNGSLRPSGFIQAHSALFCVPPAMRLE